MIAIQRPTRTKANKEHRCNFCTQTIQKGSFYEKSVWKNSEVYDWKTHEHCAQIADKLKMYDDADDGVTTEAFIENIQEEYRNVMSENYSDIYESKDFVYPKFSEQLSFVCAHHNVQI